MPKNKICRTQLPNGCSVSQISVIPKNWKQAKKVNGPWRVFYTFYDPVKGKKQVSIKKMNRCQDISDRKEATEMIIERLYQGLGMGYNPFYKKVISPQQGKYDIEENILFIPALKKALERIKIADEYRKHINGYIIPSVEKAATHLHYHVLFISEIRRKHIIYMLDYLREANKRFTDNTFNRFRTDLKILFKELVRIEAIETNPLSDIDPIPMEEKTRETLTMEERNYLNQYLSENYPNFHRLTHIFFHGGARGTELCRLKGADVDLENQRFKRQIRKGRKTRTVWTPIKDIALKYWVEQMSFLQDPNDYVFSRNLLPGSVPISSKQLTRRWYSLVKKKFVYTKGRKGGKGKYIDRVHIINGIKTVITADWYSLHHSNATEMVSILKKKTNDAEKRVAELKGHTSEAMVIKIYDVEHNHREHNEIRKVNNPFA